MFGVALTVIGPFALLLATRWVPTKEDRKRVGLTLVLGYVLRMLIQLFSRELPLFSSGFGGDWGVYEAASVTIARLWSYGGIHYVDINEMPPLGRATLPPNLFALVFYANGEPTRLGCVAVLAVLGCLACLNLFLLAVELGASRDVAFRMASLLLFLPSFVFYTSDMFKDGMVCFFIVLILGASIRLARRVSLLQVGCGVLGLLGLWLTRYYLAYVLVFPFLIGSLGVRSGSPARMAVVVIVVSMVGGIAAGYTSASDAFMDDASTAFDKGTSREVIESNTDSGSGVVIGDPGSPFAALPTKIVYTLFSPFPWQGGSLGLQLSKIEVFIWYFLLYRVVRFAKKLWGERPTDLVLLLSFIVPTTLVYTISFANIGLNHRERLGIVLITALLATLTWPAQQEIVKASITQGVGGVGIGA
jgi:hypothetical protein